MSAVSTIRERIAPLHERLEVIHGLGDMFTGCFLNTLETTVQAIAPGDTFVITGDIEAMWLRDSTAQVMHYLRFCNDPEVATLIEGLIARQAACILIDPYANAFNLTDSGRHCFQDEPVQSGHVWERKYEIDSLCYPVWLAWRYYEATGHTTFLTEKFHQALASILEVFTCEQHRENSSYWFRRADCPPQDTLSHNGKGAPVAYTGMTWSGFRPSDDACVYGYLIPSNLFAAKVMDCVERFAGLLGDPILAKTAARLRGEIRAGLDAYASVVHPVFGDIYAYETDGLGHYVLMDDANVPSLLSLPYLGVCDSNDEKYLRTRRFVLSEENPYFNTGKTAEGVGSPHTPGGYVWPISLCMQIMTSDDDDEAARLLRMLLTTHAGTCLMHESFDPDDPASYTRSWFAWANSMFGEMMYRLYESGRLDKVLRLTGMTSV